MGMNEEEAMKKNRRTYGHELSWNYRDYQLQVGVTTHNYFSFVWKAIDYVLEPELYII